MTHLSHTLPAFTHAELYNLNQITAALVPFIADNGKEALDYNTAHDIVTASSDVKARHNLYILKAWTDLVK
jgi:type IV secretory pathway VirD2 relaxase